MKKRSHQSNGFEILLIYYPKLKDNPGFMQAFKKNHGGWQTSATADKGLLQFWEIVSKPKVRKKIESALVAMGIFLYHQMEEINDISFFGEIFKNYYEIDLNHLMADFDFFSESLKKSPYEMFIDRVLSDL